MDREQKLLMRNSKEWLVDEIIEERKRRKPLIEENLKLRTEFIEIAHSLLNLARKDFPQ